MLNTEKEVVIKEAIKLNAKLYDKYTNNVETHLKRNKESIEKLGNVEKIIVQNSFKLNNERIEELNKICSKSKILNDYENFNNLIQEAKKESKKYIDIYYMIKEEAKEYINSINNINSKFKSYEEWSKYLQDKMEKVYDLNDNIRKYVNKDFEEHILKFDEYKKYKNIYNDIVSISDKSVLKYSVSSDLNERFKKSYITK